MQNIEEIALRIAKTIFNTESHRAWSYEGGDVEIKAFTRALLTELSKGVEPDYWQCRTFYEDNTSTPGWSEWKTITTQGLYTVESQVTDLKIYISRGNKYELRQLFAHPLPAEQIEQRVAEACAKAVEENRVGYIEILRSGQWREFL